ncbi:G- coupled receptor 112 [Paramuricea clavata]|nr:G- coupled receptor 112 [Paramuricea clavata]
MRVEVYECLPVKGSVPDVVGKRKQTSDIDRGGNIDLKCTMKGQAGIIINWYRNNDLIEESKSVKLKSKDVTNNRVQSTLSLYNVTINENGAKYECRGRYPGVSLLQYASFPVLLRVGVDQPPLQLPTITEDSVDINVPYRLANITVKYDFEYRAVNASKWEKKTRAPNPSHIYRIQELEPWTEYELKVTPIHRHDTGRTSRIIRFTTLQGVPDPPANVRTGHVNADNATIEWDKPSKYQVRGVIKRYIIKGIDDDNGDEIANEVVVHVDATSYPIKHLLPNRNYTVRVAIENGRKQSSFSSVSFTTRPEIPEPPTTSQPENQINLEKLNQMEIDDDNVVSVAIDVKNLTSKPKQLNPRNVSTTAEILKKIVNTNTKNSKVGDNILGTISNMLDIEDDVLEKSNSTSKFIKILEDFVKKGGTFSKNTRNIKIKILTKLDTRSGVLQQTFNNDSTILIPKEVLDKAKNKTMYFIYYKNGKLFKRKRLIKQICTDDGFTENVYEESTAVMSSGIPGQSVRNLSEKVIIKFHVADSKAVKASSSCVYWDFDAAGGAGDWSNKGCTRQRMYNNTIECACDHMTNFAALIVSTQFLNVKLSSKISSQCLFSEKALQDVY